MNAVAAMSGVGQRRLWTVDEYERMIRLGVLGEDERLELIEGEIVCMAPQDLPHANGIRRADRAVRRAFAGRGTVAMQLPLRLGEGSRPEPDVSVVAEPVPEDDEPRKLTPLLVVEVASSSLAYDRNEKASLYAKAGVPDYWIVNLLDAQLEVHRDPAELPSGRYGFGYRTRTIYRPGDAVAPLAAPEGRIQVEELFPRNR
ncbi:MAG TPA: Uma2 family endonuclease [Chloroflexota bacterium]|jgi:Uma2 family endonuclease|nr:Uma2 family endonuclease [Chloroflexota bacterium]